MLYASHALLSDTWTILQWTARATSPGRLTNTVGRSRAHTHCEASDHNNSNTREPHGVAIGVEMGIEYCKE
jgi:hypothetical protein